MGQGHVIKCNMWHKAHIGHLHTRSREISQQPDKILGLPDRFQIWPAPQAQCDRNTYPASVRYNRFNTKDRDFKLRLNESIDYHCHMAPIPLKVIQLISEFSEVCLRYSLEN